MLDDIDILLSRRAAPEPPGGLAERIIEASRRSSRAVDMVQRKPGLWQAFSELFLLPQPAFALMAVMAIGVTLGIDDRAESLLSFSGDNDVAMSDFALPEDSYEDGVRL